MESAQFHLHSELEERHWWFLARRRIVMGLIRRILPPSKRVTIVDIGCGTGGNIAALAQDYSCIGVDSSPEAIRLAQRRFPEVEFVCRPMQPPDLGPLGSRADLFLLMDVLEHVPDDCAFLSGLLAAAKPGAYFLITVPAGMDLWSEHDVSFGHYRRYDRAGLERLWRDLPVSAPLVSYYNSRLYPIAWIVRNLNRIRGHSGGQAGTDFQMPAAPVNQLLERIFASEEKVLSTILHGKRRIGFRRGVSLIAVLHREQRVLEKTHVT